MVQELFHILDCTIGTFPEWEGEVKLRLSSSFSLLLHTEHLLPETKFFVVDADYLESSVK